MTRLGMLASRLRAETIDALRHDTGSEPFAAGDLWGIGSHDERAEPFALAFRVSTNTGPAPKEYTVTISESSRR